MVLAILTPLLALPQSRGQQISLDIDKASLREVLKQIERQTTYRFSYTNEDIKPAADVSAHYTKASVTTVLNGLLKDTGLRYKIISPRLIAITRKNADAPAAGTDPGRRINGLVLDEYGDPLPGATVKCVGHESAACSSDLDGHFSITLPAGADKLAISYIGMKPLIVDAADGLTAQLTAAGTELDEVVVVGYGVQKKVNVTGAVSMVDDKVFAARPVANASQALQGAIPGLNLSTTNAGGQLNSSMTMNIRGTGTIGDGSVASPLILIDGIEGNINTLNPNDIESVSVLKDAASASIYGARAAFGVVLVTTKNGSKGRINVSYSGDIRFSSATSLPDFTNSLE
ncbi:MAG: TonB-dependent receptor plug domain-containing protein, partial [Paramuribaculum sp.]|nr:TonB-dependent receptor plug domain-containing protein [Paramuribaculum sp.]